jgi:radical SAM superfamily enzyme YgiQ (UPF0313 family)
MIDCLFVNPNSSSENYQALANDVAAIEPPVWSLLLAESCRSKGYSVEILDCDAERLTDETAIRRIIFLAPKLVCFVTYGQNPNSGTTNMVGTLRLANKLKTCYPQVLTLSIGSHTSALPLEVLSESGIDLVSINEGVYTLNDLLELLKTQQYPLMHELEKVRGLGFKRIIFENGQFSYFNQQNYTYHLNNNAQIVPQSRLDIDLPGMAWDLLPKKEKFLDLYRCHVWHNNYDPNTRSPFASLYTSLGCVKKCSFCMINIVNRTNTADNVDASFSPIMRYFSTYWVKKQLEYLTSRGVKNIRFADELFFLNRKHYEPILDSIIDKQQSINWWAYSRIDTIKDQFLTKFQQAGCNYLALGIEAASQKIRQEIDKGRFEEIDIRDIVKKIKNSGINAGNNFIFGFPNEKLENLQETLDLSIELEGDFNNYYAAVALPGSPLYFEAKKNGWELPSTLDGYGFLAYNHLPLRTHYLSAAEVLKFRDEAWHKYFESESFLNRTEQKFGLVSRRYIEEITKIKLKRKILGD